MAERVIQTIIVKKSHPKVKTAADARRIAARHGKVKKTDQTDTSFRFRQRDPEGFKPRSFRTENRTKHVRIVWGTPK